jgi:hypothetical protein
MEHGVRYADLCMLVHVCTQGAPASRLAGHSQQVDEDPDTSPLLLCREFKSRTGDELALQQL